MTISPSRRSFLLGGLALSMPAFADFYRDKENAGFFWGQRSGVLIKRSRDGLFYVNGTINGSPTTFMVDTGASHVALSEELARAVGVVGQQAVKISTASHNVIGRMGLATEIDIDGLSVRDVPVVVSRFPPGSPPALLGQSYLKHFSVSAEKNEMWLE